jgi:hypothetical protein
MPRATTLFSSPSSLATNAAGAGCGDPDASRDLLCDVLHCGRNLVAERSHFPKGNGHRPRSACHGNGLKGAVDAVLSSNKPRIGHQANRRHARLAHAIGIL